MKSQSHPVTLLPSIWLWSVSWRDNSKGFSTLRFHGLQSAHAMPLLDGAVLFSFHRCFHSFSKVPYCLLYSDFICLKTFGRPGTKGSPSVGFVPSTAVRDGFCGAVWPSVHSPKPWPSVLRWITDFLAQITVSVQWALPHQRWCSGVSETPIFIAIVWAQFATCPVSIDSPLGFRKYTVSGIYKYNERSNQASS